MANIIVVDDSPIVRRTMMFTLQRYGHCVSVAANGREALTQLQDQPTDLIFCDIDMPEMNGLDLLRQLRSENRWQTVPVIMLTASGMDADREEAEAEGANGFLLKPASTHEIVAVMAKVLP